MMAYSSSSLGNKKLKKGSGSSDHPQAPPRRANATTTTCYPSSSSPPPADEETVSVLRSYVDGTGPTVVFVHGWPDDHTMWDEQVGYLKHRFRCVTTDLPGFGADEARVQKWGYSVDEVVRQLERTVEAAGNGQPVDIVGHDWGCLFSFLLEKRRPDLIRKMVSIDVGGAVEPNKLGMMVIMSYHMWLIVAFLVGGPIGDAMARLFAWLVRAPSGHRVARASAGYPYFQWWSRKLSKRQEKIGAMMPRGPLLFLYGNAGMKKYLPFHAEWWAEEVQRKKGSSSVAMTESSHWVTKDQPDDVNRRLEAFLADD